MQSESSTGITSPVNDDSQNSEAKVQYDGNLRQLTIVPHGQGCQQYALQWAEDSGEEDEPQEGECHSCSQWLHKLFGLFQCLPPLLACSVLSSLQPQHERKQSYTHDGARQWLSVQHVLTCSNPYEICSNIRWLNTCHCMQSCVLLLESLLCGADIL